MLSTCEPETMTADERRCEVAAILAQGLLRRVGVANLPTPEPHHIELDLAAKTRLSVGQEGTRRVTGPGSTPSTQGAI